MFPVSAGTLERAQDILRALALPPAPDERMEQAIRRAADAVGTTYRKAKRLVYREEPGVSLTEAERIVANERAVLLADLRRAEIARRSAVHRAQCLLELLDTLGGDECQAEYIRAEATGGASAASAAPSSGLGCSSSRCRFERPSSPSGASGGESARPANRTRFGAGW